MTIFAKNFIIEAELDMRMTGYFYLLKKYIPLLFLGVFLMSSCSYKNRNALLKEPREIEKDSLQNIYVSNPTASYDTYRIKPYDLITLRNLQNPGLIGGESTTTNANTKDASFRVEDDGFVNLPVIGKIHILGLTRTEATKKIESLYKEKLFNDPIIELNISSLKITLLGEVANPGNFLLEKEDYDLIDILGEAGGLKEKADPKTIRIIRGDRTNPEVIYANLGNINTLKSPKLKLMNGDIVIVEKQKFYNKFDKIQSFTIITGLAVTLLNSYIILRNITN